ncbi:hypothetical protein [Pelagicoccus sp. SDUM812005]|uniref:hypothetical protein n=1 Tax=Pelagicoccus sp. SDUM812005 TaxID=3041257 RepID=UPI00280CD0A8|nr:hypothetical protein [Pelagicoccus sp. SDUM812005]MDQ8179116.1 hypothetical protein [Pelagicoccus sp. SDUM812005]
MKNRIGTWVRGSACLGAILSVLLLGTACSDKDGSADADYNWSDQAKERMSEAKAAGRESWAEFSEYTIERKAEAVAFLERKSVDLDRNIEALGDEVERLADASKVEAQKSLVELQAKRADLRLKIERAKEATVETWEEVKLESQDSWNALRESVQEMTSRVSGS